MISSEDIKNFSDSGTRRGQEFVRKILKIEVLFCEIFKTGEVDVKYI